MILYRPTLTIEKLKVFKGKKVVFDEKFHEGINAIVGRNGGGKTSIIQLLVFGLGYEVSNWKSEAKLCDRVMLEVKANGKLLTLERKGIGELKQGLSICYEGLDKSENLPRNSWYSFPYAANQKISFSQQIFNILGMAEARLDSSGNNITLHQIFRLLFSDQSNVARSLFNVEPFDSAFKRESVGNYLLGIYDNELYDAKIELVAKEKELERAVSKLQTIYSVIGKTSFSTEYSDIDSAKKFYLSKIDDLRDEIEVSKNDSLLSYPNEKKHIENGANENIRLKTELVETESSIRELEYSIDDSVQFIEELNDKLKAIEDSLKLGGVLPRLDFVFCPACYEKLKEKDNASCHLCGSEKDASFSKEDSKLLRMKNELVIQIRESQKILKRNRDRLAELEVRRKNIRSSLRKNITRVASVVVSLNSGFENKAWPQKLSATPEYFAKVLPHVLPRTQH
jgi:hypothetical protein